jgi:chromosome segregation ATPase
MTNPKPLFTAEDFPHHKFDKAEAKAIADIANAKVAPLVSERQELADKLSATDLLVSKLQAEVERAFSALRDLKDHGVKQQGEIERLREKNESLRIKHGSAMIECTRSLKEIDVLRARVAELEAEQGRYIREIIDPLNAKVARLREALEGLVTDGAGELKLLSRGYGLSGYGLSLAAALLNRLRKARAALEGKQE